MRASRVLGAAIALTFAVGLWGSAGPFVPPAVAPLFAETAPPRLPTPAGVQPVVSGTSLIVGWDAAVPGGAFEVVIRHPKGGTSFEPRTVRGVTYTRFDIRDVDFTAGPYCVQVRAIPQAGQTETASPFTDCAPVATFVCDLDWQVEAVPGAVEAVIFGSARLDVSALDPTSIRITDGSGAGTRAASARIANVRDVGGADGYADLVIRFDRAEMERNGDLDFETAAFHVQATTRGGSPACGSLDLHKSR